jgi:hypothetical protein
MTGWLAWGLPDLAASAFSLQAVKKSMQVEKRRSVVAGIPVERLACSRAIKIGFMKGSNIKSFNFR